ncbi:MAG TPA: zf-HC2 domain-containing protein [Firmicutes bacterium]|nr:zf-HC2 domain-containing protein [Bacillota bacterium]
MDCSKAIEEMSAALDDMLSPQQEAALKAHLEHCPFCRQVYEGLKEVRMMLQAEEEVPLPEGFHAQWKEKWEQERQEMARLEKKKKQDRQPWKKFLAMAAAAAAVAFVGINGSGIWQDPAQQEVGRELTQEAVAGGAESTEEMESTTELPAENPTEVPQTVLPRETASQAAQTNGDAQSMTPEGNAEAEILPEGASQALGVAEPVQSEAAQSADAAEQAAAAEDAFSTPSSAVPEMASYAGIEDAEEETAEETEKFAQASDTSQEVGSVTTQTPVQNERMVPSQEEETGQEAASFYDSTAESFALTQEPAAQSEGLEAEVVALTLQVSDAAAVEEALQETVDALGGVTVEQPEGQWAVAVPEAVQEEAKAALSNLGTLTEEQAETESLTEALKQCHTMMEEEAVPAPYAYFTIDWKEE